eukprot:CAMPEP_0118702512 /NCGR_PEP_ID=MMETSP0800-20121206/17937_1 /TAXON_ID=210618 ORGANISM="Striatella unipunctata, Strain CCMP2910" /NCGR_SAMPLE_ID=MMETSP0800 /ASSEMBLY_ACC=CAM_ASM_000638 /LENGTH=97 /DNA_ID=CAMNT_0006603731 /DNA_START=62 /DNA_END=355 /DNA_ORIENTATION=-
MVKVWYEPPPYGPRTSLNRPPYGLGNEARMAPYLVKLSKMPQWQSIGGAIGLSLVLAWLPLMNQKMPFTMSPEYQAASRAYMRYHNMNPIFGDSKDK